MLFRGHWKALLVVVAASLCALGSISGSGLNRTLILKVEGDGSAWAESRLAEHLTLALSRYSHLRVTDADKPGKIGQPEFPADRYNLDSLVNWGKEVGGRYLLHVVVRSTRLERHRDMHVPFLIHRYSNVGIIEGELRCYDLTWGRTVVAEPFRIKAQAKMVMQMSIDNDRHDPGLHIPAPEKAKFFDELDQKLTDHILKQIESILGGQE